MNNINNFLHEAPIFLNNLLERDLILSNNWNKLTLLMKNEWICWMTIPKKEETKKEHVIRFIESVKIGEKRPCCWPGCPHRRISSQKYFSNKK